MHDHFLTLERLGFSSNQAKVFLALVSLGNSADVKSIEEVSGVHREEIYRKLNDLQEMGFVERIFSRPVMFRAIPLESVIHVLLHRKSDEISNLQIETEKLLQELRVEEPNSLLVAEAKVELDIRMGRSDDALQVFGMDQVPRRVVPEESRAPVGMGCTL